MTEPYLVAMEHAEFRAQAILRKHIKNRPFGRLQRHYQYMPPQPVLSCRTVNVDVTGTRTYRAKSATDIIDEQQRLIHHVYRQARNVVSAPPRRNYSTSPVTATIHTLRDLSVHGNKSLSPRVSQSSTGWNKPNSAHRSTPNNTPALSSSKKNVPNLFQHDPEWNETSRAYHDTNQQVRDLWSDEKHSLDEGQFIRGKKDGQLASLDPKTGNQWLVFGGGQDTTSAGVVDAFTAMKSEEELYTIDGTTGSHVAKQLHKGDKIRVGVNGNVKSPDAKIKQWAAEQEKQLREAEERQRGRKGAGVVPLCWQDQLNQESIKVVSPRAADDNSKSKSLCESHPVIVNDLQKKHHTDSGPKKGVKINEGYQVKVRSKVHGPNRLDSPASRVTASITIDREDETFEKDLESLTYDDILQMKVQGSHAMKNDAKSEDGATGVSSAEKIDGSRGATPVPEGSSEVIDEGLPGKTVSSSPDVVDISQRSPSRPATALSHGSQRTGLDDLVVGHAPPGHPVSRSPQTPLTFTSPQHAGAAQRIGSAQHTGSAPQIGSTPRLGSAQRLIGTLRSGSARADHRTAPRVMSAGRPRPLRSNIQRTSTSLPGNRADTEFIQISQGMTTKPLSNETLGPLEPPPPTPGPSTQVALESIAIHNQLMYQSDSSHMGEDLMSLQSAAVSHTTQPPASDYIPSLISTPPPSPSPSPDLKFAFDIPTADTVESEANSQVAPGDLEKGLSRSLQSVNS